MLILIFPLAVSFFVKGCFKAEIQALASGPSPSSSSWPSNFLSSWVCWLTGGGETFPILKTIIPRAWVNWPIILKTKCWYAKKAKRANNIMTVSSLTNGCPFMYPINVKALRSDAEIKILFLYCWNSWWAQWEACRIPTSFPNENPTKYIKYLADVEMTFVGENRDTMMRVATK